MNSRTVEFQGIRSSMYREVLAEFPNVRNEELQCGLEVLSLKESERVLEVGAGTGFFSTSIASLIGPGNLVITDPSVEQLKGISRELNQKIHLVQAGAESLDDMQVYLKDDFFDVIFCGGAFHHVGNKTAAFTHFNRLLTPGGKVVIVDVFSGSKLAKYFDTEVARYCITGHEVSFLTEEFAESLCFISGFENPTFTHLPVKWKFKSLEDLSTYLYKLHAMIGTTANHCLEQARNILGVEENEEGYSLHWPLTAMVAYRKNG